jgi:hypothetical protein
VLLRSAVLRRAVLRVLCRAALLRLHLIGVEAPLLRV